MWKSAVQSAFRAAGYRIERNHPRGLDAFFAMLITRGFAPRHIIDVGANHGGWTRAALKYFPDAYYTMIEPQADLRNDVAHLLNSKIRWINAGASDAPGTLPFQIAAHDYRSSFLVNGGPYIEVPVITLNDLIRDGVAPFPDMVKIDAEGFDLKVLDGASNLLGKTEIFLVEATICARGRDNTLRRVVNYMSDRGYDPIDLTDLNRTIEQKLLWVCELAFLRTESKLLDGISHHLDDDLI